MAYLIFSQCTQHTMTKHYAFCHGRFSRVMRFNNSLITVTALLWFIKLSCHKETCTMIKMSAIIKWSCEIHRLLSSPSPRLLSLSLTRLCVSLSASHTYAHTCPSQSSELLCSCYFCEGSLELHFHSEFQQHSPAY